MQQQQQLQKEEDKEDKEEGRGKKRGVGREGRVQVDLFFAHDSTVLPLVALLDLVRVGGEGGWEGRRKGEEGEREDRVYLLLDFASGIWKEVEGGRDSGREAIRGAREGKEGEEELSLFLHLVMEFL